ncbi:hypothetical protein [Enterococcus lemanii]|jgi:hypothetical protein|uniref:Uncharacterized protein n=1 Tax=Enterococcus lemanii TaxID=1159752 RepID=A0ABV9MWC6_9ENTE|nr:hypothetical protein [Enterococcus lemanii]MBM7710008.1 hypothetical protein [Enterococcus lemanii]NLM68033.1 hypothetical protein [Enterococcus sp.]
MRNQWLDEELKKIETSENQFLLSEVRKYIEQLEDDNESLQIALEGSIWSPNRWNEGTKK